MSVSCTGTTHSIRVASPTAYPGATGTVAIRLKPNWNYNDNADHKIWWHVYTDIADPSRLQFQKYSDNNVYIGWYASGGSDNDRITYASASGNFTNGVWNSHVFTWSDSANTEEYWIGGVSKATRTSALETYTVSNSLTIGNANAASTANNSNASFADYALWDVILTADEILAYDKGLDPRMIRPGSLQRYAPLNGRPAEPDLLCADGWTVTDAGRDVNPRRIDCIPIRVGRHADAAPAGSTITTATLPAGLGAMGSGQTRAIQPAGLSYMG